MVERWNIGFQKDNSHFNFIVNLPGFVKSLNFDFYAL